MNNEWKNITRDELYNEYHIEKRSTVDIANKYQIAAASVLKKMKKFEIDRRSRHEKFFGRDFSGIKFNDIDVIRKIKPKNTRRSYKQGYWECKCKCGNIFNMQGWEIIKKERVGCQNCSKTGSRNSKFNGYEGIGLSYWRRCKLNAEKSGREFNITIEYMWDLFVGQNQLCKISGIPIAISTGRKNQTASLDRIDSSKGYIVGNVQWVHKDINKAKSNFNQDVFIEMCHKISDYQRGKV
jgi:hypothetical protein